MCKFKGKARMNILEELRGKRRTVEIPEVAEISKKA
jgi:hypothetical protein